MKGHGQGNGTGETDGHGGARNGATRMRVNAGGKNADQSAQGLIRRQTATGLGALGQPAAQNARSKPSPAVVQTTRRRSAQSHAPHRPKSIADKRNTHRRTGQASEPSTRPRRACRPRFPRRHTRRHHQADWTRNHPNMNSATLRPPLTRNAPLPAARWPARVDREVAARVA